MKTYESVYSFVVIDKIREGKTVFVLDKENEKVMKVNELTVDQLMRLLRNDESTPNRYYFWYSEETDNETN